MYGKEFEADVEALEARYPADQRRAALLGQLHLVQDRIGHVPAEAVRWLAERHGTSVTDIHGVLSFYTMYFTEPPGKHVIWLCRTFSCQLMGGVEVARGFERALGCKVGETDSTGTFHLRWMECLAACDAAPCALIGDDMYERLTPAAVEIVLAHVRAGGGGGSVQAGDDGRPALVPLAVAERA